jgi:hypothetical protein
VKDFVISTEATRLFLAHGLCAPGRVVEGSWQPRSANLNRCDPTSLEQTSRLFPTTIHQFAQPHPLISIDARKRQEYRARQIEPRSLETLRLTFEGVAA